MSTLPGEGKESKDTRHLEHECKKFRICIIGRSGVGKSTLLGKVFGFSDDKAKVRKRGQGRGLHNVWDPIQNDARNRALIIHDSGGFEAGESGTLETVMEFIKYRNEQGQLSEQLHCIWYCIALSDARPIQTAEEDFFEFFHDKNIPLVFVFTKYDRLVRDIQDEISGGAEEVTMNARVEAEQQARNYVDEMRYKLECAIGRGVKVQEVSNKDDELVKKLVKETTDLVKPNLQSVWIRAQGVLATQKREECVRTLPSLFKPVLLACSVPLNPTKSIMLTDLFKSMFHICALVWNIPGQDVLFIKDDIIERFRDSVQSHIWQTNLAATFDFSGPTTAAVYIRLALKMACDLVLIFQALFWATTRTKFLREQDLNMQLDQYKTSNVRDMVHRLIDGSIGALNVIKAYQEGKIKEILDDVVQNGALHLREQQETAKEKRDKVTKTSMIGPLSELPG